MHPCHLLCLTVWVCACCLLFVLNLIYSYNIDKEAVPVTFSPSNEISFLLNLSFVFLVNSMYIFFHSFLQLASFSFCQKAPIFSKLQLSIMKTLVEPIGRETLWKIHSGEGDQPKCDHLWIEIGFLSFPLVHYSVCTLIVSMCTLRVPCIMLSFKAFYIGYNFFFLLEKVSPRFFFSLFLGQFK